MGWDTSTAGDGHLKGYSTKHQHSTPLTGKIPHSTNYETQNVTGDIFLKILTQIKICQDHICHNLLLNNNILA